MLHNKKFCLLSYSKFIVAIVVIFMLAGCANRYYFKKRIDIFNPTVEEQFTVADYNNNQYSDIIINKLKEKLTDIPLQYSRGGFVPYLVYFNYKNRYFWFPMLRVTILKQSNKLGTSDEVLYDSMVYSYNTNKLKSLAAALKIITDDLVNREYPKSRYIKVTLHDLSEKPKNQLKQAKQKVKQKASSKRANERYRLYDNKALYKE